MALRNFQSSVEHDLARHEGELEELRDQIAEAKRLIEALQLMLDRASALEEVIKAAGKLLRFRSPNWQPDSVKPTRRTAQFNPVPFGETSRTALSILRESARPLRTRDVAKEVLRRFGVEEADRNTLDRITNSVQASFRNYAKRGVVKHSDDFVQLWEVIR